MDSIVLTGFMGAGKTTIGQNLSRQSGMRFLDTDEYIEKSAGMSIKEIFSRFGEEYFRELETKALKTLKNDKEKSIISCGGGIIVKERNHSLLKELGTVVYIRVKPETVFNRLKNDTSRPLLQGSDAYKKICELMDKRADLYEKCADIIADTDELSPSEASDSIYSMIIRHKNCK